LSQIALAQVNCEAMPTAPARTDCYIGLSHAYQGKSDVAAGNARVQSDAARLQQVTGTESRPNASKHRRKKLPQSARNEVEVRPTRREGENHGLKHSFASFDIYQSSVPFLSSIIQSWLVWAHLTLAK